MNNYTRLSNAFDRPGGKLNPILFVVRTNEVPGAWIRQRCYETYCEKYICYWSKTGKVNLEKLTAKCEVHRNV